MAEMNQVLSQARQFWSSRTSRQRLFLGLGAVATAALVAVFANLIVAPEYKPLMNGLEPADAQSISAELTAKKIPFQLSPDGKSISVPADQLDAARLDVAGTDATHSGRMGFEIFDKVAWGQTEFDEKVNYQRALEGELERTIMTLAGVRSARVHLVMATGSVFLDRERAAKASVTLKVSRSGLTREETASIQRLVAGAVDGLKPADVSIINADSNQAIRAPGDAFPGEEGMERQLTQRLIATLLPVVGNDHLRASVNVEYDPGTTEESQEKYDPTVAVPLTMQKSDEQTGPGGVGGVPGTTSNVPQTSPNVPPPVGDDSTQVSKSENTTYGVNKSTRHSIEPAGRIRRITAALLVDDLVNRQLGSNGKWTETHVKRSSRELQQIEMLASNAIGLDPARGDVISIQNLSFTQPEQAELPPASVLDRARKEMSDYSTVVRYAMLLLLFVVAYLLMIRPLQKKVLAAAIEEPLQPSLAGAVLSSALTLSEPTGTEAANTLALKEQVVQQIKSRPATSARVVQAWLQGGE